MIWEHLREYRKFYSKEEEECCKDISQEDKKNDWIRKYKIWLRWFDVTQI